MLVDYLLEMKIRTTFKYMLKLSKRKKNVSEVHGEVKKMLFNILPPLFVNDIINGTIEKDKYIVKNVKNGSVMFADLVSFTKYSEDSKPIELISILNCIFAYYDVLSLMLQLEKVSTQGDAFISIGISGNIEDHLTKQILFGYGMIKTLSNLCKNNKWKDIKIRIGITYGELYLVCLGSLNSGITFDVFGKPLKMAQFLQNEANESSILVESKVKNSTFVYNEKEGTGDNFFNFVENKKYFELKNDFLLEKELTLKMKDLVQKAQSISFGGNEIEALKLSYYQTQQKGISSEIKNFKEEKKRVGRIKKVLKNNVGNVKKFFNVIGNDDYVYINFLMIFKKWSHQIQFEKVKNKNSFKNNSQ